MKKLIIALLLLFSAYNAYSMGSLGAKLGQLSAKSIAKKSFSGLMTGLHWSIAIGAPILHRLSFSHEKTKHLISIDEDNNETTHFIRSEFKRHNTPINCIMLIPFPWGTIECGVNGTKKLMIGEKKYKQLKKAIITNDRQEKMKSIAVFHHESNHLRNNDHNRFIQFLFISPFITHALSKVINKTIVPPSMKMNSFVAKQFIKIPSGGAKSILSIGGLAALSRYQEQRADNGIEDDIEILKGAKAALEEYINKKPTTENGSVLSRAWQCYTASHPSTESRIAKLDQRILLLEKSQQKQEQTK